MPEIINENELKWEDESKREAEKGRENWVETERQKEKKRKTGKTGGKREIENKRVRKETKIA